MWTNNFKLWTRGLFIEEYHTELIMVNGEDRQFVYMCIPNESHTLGYFMKTARCEEPSVSTDTFVDCSGVYFGSGSTPATATDYKLANPITSGLTITNQGSVTISEEAEDRYTATAGYLLMNTSDTEINIYEVGLIGVLAGKYSYAPSPLDYRTCLLERQVLPKPVIIAPGETKFVTYKLIFNQILNVE